MEGGDGVGAAAKVDVDFDGSGERENKLKDVQAAEGGRDHERSSSENSHAEGEQAAAVPGP